MKNQDIDNEYKEGVNAWSEQVEGNDLALEIKSELKKYCSLSQEKLTAITLWILSTYTINSFSIYPKLLVSSPTKRCGKSTTLDVVDAFSNKSITVSNITPASMFRVIEDWQPTLIIDEGDTFINKGDGELTGIINSGHKRTGAFVIRCVGQSHEPLKMSTWAPMCIAMIGKPASTINDRSITIELKRKGVNDAVHKMPADLKEISLDQRRKCQRWYDDNKEKIEQHTPLMPKTENDRAADNWEPILTIADLLGGDWPNLARYSMSTIENVSEDESVANMLLTDINEFFNSSGQKSKSAVATEEIINYLSTLEDRPWPEFRNDRPITPVGLATELKPFGIKPGTIRPGYGVTKKGYKRDQFTNTFSLYLPKPVLAVTTSQVSNGAPYSVTGTENRSALKKVADTLQANEINGCDVVTGKSTQGSGFGEMIL